MTPKEALKNIEALVDGTSSLKDDRLRRMILEGVIVIAQKGLGIAPDGVAEHAPNVLLFPCRDSNS